MKSVIKEKENLIETNMFYNYSSITLSGDMKDLLNLAFNYATLPRLMDITQTFVDLKYFERTMIWKEF